MEHQRRDASLDSIDIQFPKLDVALLFPLFESKPYTPMCYPVSDPTPFTSSWQSFLPPSFTTASLKRQTVRRDHIYKGCGTVLIRFSASDWPDLSRGRAPASNGIQSSELSFEHFEPCLDVGLLVGGFNGCGFFAGKRSIGSCRAKNLVVVHQRRLFGNVLCVLFGRQGLDPKNGRRPTRSLLPAVHPLHGSSAAPAAHDTV